MSTRIRKLVRRLREGMNLKATTEIRHVLVCPSCGKGSFAWGHLQAGQRFGPWFCDECGAGIHGIAMRSGGADVEIVAGERKQKRLALLKLAKTDEPVLIVIDSSRVRKDDESEEETQEHDRYLYEESTCPTNYLGVELIVRGQDPDPHGVFAFVCSVPDSGNGNGVAALVSKVLLAGE